MSDDVCTEYYVRALLSRILNDTSARFILSRRIVSNFCLPFFDGFRVERSERFVWIVVDVRQATRTLQKILAAIPEA